MIVKQIMKKDVSTIAKMDAKNVKIHAKETVKTVKLAKQDVK